MKAMSASEAKHHFGQSIDVAANFCAASIVSEKPTRNARAV